MKKTTPILLILLIFYSCEKKQEITPFFPLIEKILEIPSCINKDYLASVENIESNDSSLVLTDYYDGYIFTLFDVRNGNYQGRFGAIGQGPTELLTGCDGILTNNQFTLFLEETGFTACYSIDSLFKNISTPYTKRHYYKIPEGLFSKVIPLEDSTLYLGAGVYKDNFQFCLFNTTNEILDFHNKIYNANNSQMNKYHKFLSNQGILKKKPDENKFIYALYNSSRLDFIFISSNLKIEILKSYHLKNPEYDIWDNGELNRVLPNEHSIVGYLDISTTSNYVYTLFSNEKLIKQNNTQNPNCSKTILVYNWNGEPVKKIELPYKVFHISINESRQEIYGTYMDTDKNWRIGFFSLNNIQ